MCSVPADTTNVDSKVMTSERIHIVEARHPHQALQAMGNKQKKTVPQRRRKERS